MPLTQSRRTMGTWRLRDFRMRTNALKCQFHQHFCSDHKSANKTLITDNLLDCLLALLGSARVKAASKHVGEIDPRDFVLAC